MKWYLEWSEYRFFDKNYIIPFHTDKNERRKEIVCQKVSDYYMIKNMDIDFYDTLDLRQRFFVLGFHEETGD